MKSFSALYPSLSEEIDYQLFDEQRVKLFRDCHPAWRGHRTKLDPCLFIRMIIDLTPPVIANWKYIDDTTTFDC